MKKLEKKIDYSFSDETLLEHAMTHSSYSNERGLGRAGCNERLEFLGDSILGYFAADYLFRSYPDKPEGDMTKLRAELVCEQSLVSVAEELELGNYLRLGHGEIVCGGRERPSIMADAVEALIAAMYLDGGLEAAKKFIYSFILNRPIKAGSAGSHDYKTRLQEITQRSGAGSPRYSMTGSSGPDHCKEFSAEVEVGGKVLGTGSGRSKKEAEQSAAKNAIEAMGK